MKQSKRPFCGTGFLKIAVAGLKEVSPVAYMSRVLFSEVSQCLVPGGEWKLSAHLNLFYLYLREGGQGKGTEARETETGSNVLGKGRQRPPAWKTSLVPKAKDSGETWEAESGCRGGGHGGEGMRRWGTRGRQKWARLHRKDFVGSGGGKQIKAEKSGKSVQETETG